MPSTTRFICAVSGPSVEPPVGVWQVMQSMRLGMCHVTVRWPVLNGTSTRSSATIVASVCASSHW